MTSPPSDIPFDYDFVVVGGGSGGLASSKAAAALGARVLVFDFVKPSTQGTRWGLGGTCVNVGCVPKKLMHYAASMQQLLSWDALKMGWGDFEGFNEETGEPIQKHKHCDWQRLVQCVQSYVKQLNFSYRTGLRSSGCTYINALATLTGPHSLEYEEKGQKKVVTAKHILIAVGGRPSIPRDVPGAREFCITSDDIFSLKKAPGKTLVVGASYIALECAGFLTELGFEVIVAVRSILLRGFDRQCALKVGRCMREMGVAFVEGVLVEKVEKTEEGKLKVSLRGSVDAARTQQMEVDTVLYATGRCADTRGLNLEMLGVHQTAEGRIVCDEGSRSTVPSIYAVGDVVDGFPELTPAAIRAGEILARRLFGGSTEVMNIHDIPTTVFTPMEYGCVGLSEEAAVAKYGEDDVEVFLSEFCPLELSACHRQKAEPTRVDDADVDLTPPCLSKLVCIKSEGLRVAGVHFVGPHAGELLQGMAIAVKLGAKKEDFDNTVGIHPTNAECFTQLTITKRSGQDWVAAGGCGGGKCG
ncbi:hypothetical protein Efla_000664 [Eimeria flavescens]